jgi:hypothetical protein
MSTQGATVAGGVVGLAAGIIVSIATELPLAPEVGLVAGALIGWSGRRRGEQR